MVDPGSRENEATIDALLSICDGSKGDEAAVAAAIAILDLGFGKPPQVPQEP